MALTNKQQAFCIAMIDPYLSGQTEAARRAGFSGKRAAATATELMRKPEIVREIDRLKAKKMEVAIGVVEQKAKGGGSLSPIALPGVRRSY